MSVNESDGFKKIPFLSCCFCATLALVFLLASALWFFPHQISGRGGLPIPGEIVISVPQFFQGDPRWRKDLLGETSGTLAAEGCALSSATMVLGFYGIDVDPGRLNRFLTENNGYEGNAWLRWESAAAFSPGIVEKAYEDRPSYALIDWNLFRGNPVIIRIRRADGKLCYWPFRLIGNIQ